MTLLTTWWARSWTSWASSTNCTDVGKDQPARSASRAIELPIAGPTDESRFGRRGLCDSELYGCAVHFEPGVGTDLGNVDSVDAGNARDDGTDRDYGFALLIYDGG